MKVGRTIEQQCSEGWDHSDPAIEQSSGEHFDRSVDYTALSTEQLQSFIRETWGKKVRASSHAPEPDTYRG